MTDHSDKQTVPGRSCPLSYRTRPQALAGSPGLEADTLYIIGGLYGNAHALDATEALATTERDHGLPAPRLVFNGDFNWFNAEPESFGEINRRVSKYTCLQGNVEAELASPDATAGCGCGYPPWVEEGMVDRSNRIMESLQHVAAAYDDVRDALCSLPRQLCARVGKHRIGIIHGDPESLAGWGLAVEHMPPPGQVTPTLETWFRQAGVDIFAATHTCLPFMQDFVVDGSARLVLNNGAAGMPNFHGTATGILTRISRWPAPSGRLYGTRLDELFIDAIGFEATSPAWLAWFEQRWPPGSPAHVSYRARLDGQLDYTREQALRLAS